MLHKQNNGLISVIQILLNWQQRLRDGKLLFLKAVHTDTNDGEYSSRPNSTIVPENIKKVYILTNHKLKFRKIADELNVSVGNAFTFLHEFSAMKKSCSKWVPLLCTVNQDQQHNDYSEELFGAD